MAPEQCGTPDWEGRIGPAADVFGLARRCGGPPPGRRPTRAGAATRPEERFPQLAAPIDEPPRPLPEGLEALLRAGLARDPADRPAARELAAGFEPLLEALPTRAPRGRGRR